MFLSRGEGGFHLAQSWGPGWDSEGTLTCTVAATPQKRPLLLSGLTLTCIPFSLPLPAPDRVDKAPDPAHLERPCSREAGPAPMAGPAGREPLVSGCGRPGRPLHPRRPTARHSQGQKVMDGRGRLHSHRHSSCR